MSASWSTSASASTTTSRSSSPSAQTSSLTALQKTLSAKTFSSRGRSSPRASTLDDASVFSALALGSWWAMVPLAGLVFLFFRRTAIEDQYLHKNLEGYPEYAKTVRYRCLPLVW